MTQKFIDMTGQTFGELTVLSKSTPPTHLKSNLNISYWSCVCSCGNTQIFRGNSLRHSEFTKCSICSKEARKQEKSKISNIGYSNNNLTIIEDAPERDKHGNFMCLAKCSCGKEIKIAPCYIKNGNTKSCGCIKIEAIKKEAEKRRIDLTGQVFTYLTVVKYVGFSSAGHSTIYTCKCICGKLYNVKTSHLKLGEVTSCGCKTGERLSLAQGGNGIPYSQLSLNTQIRKMPQYKEWRLNILNKYNYTCQATGVRGGNLHVHHIIPLNIMVKTYNITQDNLHSYYNLVFNKNNGMVLLEELHQDFHNQYGSDADEYMLNEYLISIKHLNPESSI